MDSERDRDEEYRRRARSGEQPRYYSKFFSHLKALMDKSHPFATVFVDKRVLGLAASAEENEKGVSLMKRTLSERDFPFVDLDFSGISEEEIEAYEKLLADEKIPQQTAPAACRLGDLLGLPDRDAEGALVPGSWKRPEWWPERPTVIFCHGLGELRSEPVITRFLEMAQHPDRQGASPLSLPEDCYLVLPSPRWEEFADHLVRISPQVDYLMFEFETPYSQYAVP